MESLPNDIKIQILKFIPRRVHPCSHMIKCLRRRDEFEFRDDDFITSLRSGKHRILNQCCMYPSHAFHHLYLFSRAQDEQAQSEAGDDPMW